MSDTAGLNVYDNVDTKINVRCKILCKYSFSKPTFATGLLVERQPALSDIQPAQSLSTRDTLGSKDRLWRSVIQEEQQLAGQGGLQQSMSVVCLLV